MVFAVMFPVTSRSMPTVTLPVTSRLFSEPTSVMLVCTGSNNVPITLLTVNVPSTAILPTVTLPVTASDTSVPTDVIFV